MLYFLIGYMGSGKSSLGKRLAGRLGYAFTDLDAMVEDAAGKSIPDIFKKDGEDYFRNLEKEALSSCFKMNDCVIATGGGTPCYMDNMQQMVRHGITVYIRMHHRSLASRLLQSHTKRPLLQDIKKSEIDEYIKQHIQEREKYYLQAQYILKGENLDVNSLYTILKDALSNENNL